MMNNINLTGNTSRAEKIITESLIVRIILT